MIGNVVAGVTGISTPPNAYYLAASTSSGSSFMYDAFADSSKNMYAAGVLTESATDYTATWKYDSNFSSSWKRRLNTGANGVGSFVVVDSSGNVYVSFNYQSGGLYRGAVAKYNSSGALQWQRTLTPTSQQIYAYHITLDSSANVYVIYGHTDSGDHNFLLVKYNSSGVLQWQREWVVTYGNYGIGVGCDSGDNPIVTGYRGTATYNNGFIMKFNSSGTKQWHRDFAMAAGSTLPNQIQCDGTDAYTIGRAYDTTWRAYVAKYNSSGTIQWQRTLDSAGTDEYTGVSFDSSNNVYMCGYSGTSGLLAKYNSSGTIQWQRTLTITGKTVRLYGIKVTSDGIYFSGYKSKTNNDAFFGKVPLDGTKTGSYSLDGQTIDYAASSLTEAAGTLTDSSGTSTITTPTKTDAAGTFTDSAATTTDSKVTL